MKMVPILIICLTLFIGCSAISTDDNQEQIEYIDNSTKQDKIPSELNISSSHYQTSQYVEPAIENPSNYLENQYCFQRQKSPILYKSKTTFFADIDELKTLGLLVNHIMDFENAKLFELKVDYNEDFSVRYSIGWDRLFLGYFYVTDKTILFFRDPQILNDGENAILKYAAVVCQEEAMDDKLAQDEKGFHEYIEVDGDQIIYNGYNNLVETGFFERFVWKKGIGLESYVCGFGAYKDAIQLDIIAK